VRLRDASRSRRVQPGAEQRVDERPRDLRGDGQMTKNASGEKLIAYDLARTP
jgi:hypothetical protein